MSDDGLSNWSTRPLRGGAIVELVNHTGHRLMLVGAPEGELLAREHNNDIERARNCIAELRAHGSDRTTIGDVEAMLVRVLVAALKELARGCLPRRLRPRPHPVHKPVRDS